MPAALPPIIKEQILRLKKRGQLGQLDVLRQRLPVQLRPLLDSVLVPDINENDKIGPIVLAENHLNQGVAVTVSTNQENVSSSQINRSTVEVISSSDSLILAEIQEVKKKLEVIQQTSGFKVGPSLAYEGIQEQVKIQLLTDNIRMENALLDTTTYQRFGEELAFRRYCVFAFYQVEELINLYYHTKYGDNIQALRSDWGAFRPPVTFDEKCASLTGITTGTKIFAYTRSSSEGDTMNSLRHVRNMEEHRCTTVLRKYANDVPKLQVQFDALRLPEKYTEAKKNGKKFEKTSEEKELEGRLIAIRFLSEPVSNVVIVRGVLKRLYESVLALNKKA